MPRDGNKFLLIIIFFIIDSRFWNVFFSTTMAQRGGKGNIVLKHYITYFQPNFEALCVERRNPTPGFFLGAGTKQWKYS